MIKDIKYTSENLFDVQSIRNGIFNNIQERRIQIRILEGEIEQLTEVMYSLEKHINNIEEQDKKTHEVKCGD